MGKDTGEKKNKVDLHSLMWKIFKKYSEKEKQNLAFLYMLSPHSCK